MSARLRALLPPLLLAAGLAAALLVCLGPIANPDVPWHLAVGRWIAGNGRVPRADFLSWTMRGRPWVDFEWAAQALYHLLDRAGGLGALWAFKSAQFGLLTLLLWRLLRLWSLPPAWAALALPAFTAALFPFLDLRPEAFSMIFALLQLHALEEGRLGRRDLSRPSVLAGHVLLYAAWANLHPGFPVGLALCASYALGESATLRRVPWSSPAARLAAAGLAGTLLNPYGPRLYLVFAEHWRDIESLRRLVIEWSPPGFRNGYQHGYWALAVFSLGGLALCAFRGGGIPAEHVAVAALFALFSSRAFRTTVYSILLVYPLALHAWSRTPSPRWWPPLRPAVLAVLALLGGWRTREFAREQRFLRAFSAPGRVAPERTCAFLRRHKAVLSGLPLFNTYNWGGYLDYALHPDYPVFMDGRYLFAGLLARTADAERHPGRWRRMMDEMGVGLALLENNGHMIRAGRDIFWRAFDAYAMPRAQWALVYWDSEGVVLVRRDKVPVMWLDAHEFRLLRPRDLRHLGVRVAAGEVPEADVAAEIERYAREIGDPRESLGLMQWRRELRKGLAAAQAKP